MYNYTDTLVHMTWCTSAHLQNYITSVFTPVLVYTPIMISGTHFHNNSWNTCTGAQFHNKCWNICTGVHLHDKCWNTCTGVHLYIISVWTTVSMYTNISEVAPVLVHTYILSDGSGVHFERKLLARVLIQWLRFWKQNMYRRRVSMFVLWHLTKMFH